MGINNEAKSCFPVILERLGKERWEGVSILEYGNQLVRDMTERTTGKKYFESLGARHVSIDINGLDGVLKFDLSKPLPYVGGPFDLVTNFGTTEHVVNNQYYPFKTMHDNCRKGGILLSIVPTWTFRPNHGTYRYDAAFFEDLANANNYDIIRMEISKKPGKGNLFIAMFQKVNDDEFISEKVFNSIPGLVKLDRKKYKNWEVYEKKNIK